MLFRSFTSPSDNNNNKVVTSDKSSDFLLPWQPLFLLSGSKVIVGYFRVVQPSCKDQALMGRKSVLLIYFFYRLNIVG